MVEEDRSAVPIDRGWAWMIVLGYFISVFCMVGIAKSFGIFLEEFVVFFDIPVALAALIMGVSGGVYTISAPICMAAGQHFSQRRVVMLGGLVGGIGLSLSGLLFNIEWVIITFGALFGFGNACMFGNGLVMIGQYFSKYRSVANGLALSGASIGQFALPPLLRLLLDTYSLKGTLIILGGVYFNVIMCGMLYRPLSYYTKPNLTHSGEDEKLISEKLEPDPDKEKSADIEMLGDGSHKVRPENGEKSGAVRFRTVSNGSVVLGSVDSLHTLAVDTSPTNSKNAQRSVMEKLIDFIKSILDFTVLRSYIVIMFVAVSFLLFFGHFNFVLFMPAAATSRGISKPDAAWLVSVNGICDLFGRLLIGVAGDFKILERYKLMAVSTFLCSISIFCFSFPDTFGLMAVCVGLYGFFGGCYVAINAPALIDMVGLQSLPKVLGVVLFIQGLGAAIGQPVLGAIRDAMGTYQLVNYINSVSMMAGSILLFLYPIIRRTEEKRNQQLTQEITVEPDV